MPQLDPAGHMLMPVPGVKVPMLPGATGAGGAASALRRLVGPGLRLREQFGPQLRSSMF
jgi:hypothetical protein